MINKYISIFIIALCCVACEPQEDAKPDIGAPPSNPSFDITQGSTPNEFILTNTTPDAFLTFWDLGTAGQREGEQVEVILPFIGTYDVKMTTFNKGGSGSTTQSINVTQDDPNACFGNVQMLTDCMEKTWKIAPEAGALYVGPDLNTVWWENSETDVTDRACHFNDEYIFRKNGEFEYKSNGDFWADSDGDGNIYPPDLAIEVGCHPNTDWPSAYQAWDSGLHSFDITNNTLKVNGEGAWIGLYKVGTSGDVLEPQQSVTYNIESISNTRMILVADYGEQIWKFTLAAQ